MVAACSPGQPECDGINIMENMKQSASNIDGIGYEAYIMAWIIDCGYSWPRYERYRTSIFMSLRLGSSGNDVEIFKHSGKFTLDFIWKRERLLKEGCKFIILGSSVLRSSFSMIVAPWENYCSGNGRSTLFNHDYYSHFAISIRSSLYSSDVVALYILWLCCMPVHILHGLDPAINYNPHNPHCYAIHITSAMGSIRVWGGEKPSSSLQFLGRSGISVILI